MPGVTPVTIPVAVPTEALALLLLHEPTDEVSLRTVVKPLQTWKEPKIADGNGSMVTIAYTANVDEGNV